MKVIVKNVIPLSSEILILEFLSRRVCPSSSLETPLPYRRRTKVITNVL